MSGRAPAGSASRPVPAVLALLVARLGTGPFVDGLRALDARSLLAALAVTRRHDRCAAPGGGGSSPAAWGSSSRCAGRRGVLPLPVAQHARCPAASLGDVHRGVRHGRTVRHTGRGLRAVAWERLAGQVVQVAVAVVVLLVLPSPVRLLDAARARSSPRSLVPLAALVVRAAGARASASDLRALPTRAALPGVLLLSLFGGRAGTSRVFLVAARDRGGRRRHRCRLLPLALLVLLAMAVPANVAGWGPREGVAAWAFAAAGLGAAAGRRDRGGVRRAGARREPARRRRAGRGGASGVARCPSPSWRWPVADRPYTLLSCGMSLDGYLDGPGEDRLLLSNDADFDRVDAVRAECDAILVGAATVRNDDPRLLVRSPARRAQRVARGLCPSPVKVTVTEHGRPGRRRDFFTAGDADKLVYCPTGVGRPRPAPGWARSPPSSTAATGSTYAG